MKKNTTLELTINPKYVQNWDLWCAIRELIQNALDANDIGYPMKIEFKQRASGGVLCISNEGISLDRSTLLLGSTTKATDSRQRGQFGEGFKLAWLVLVRLNRNVWCKSGAERWVPKFGHSDTFGSDLLMVDIAPAKHENIVLTEVEILSEEWEEIKKRVLHLIKTESINTLSGSVLLAEEYKGLLFANGLFVGKLPGNYQYGYDLYHVSLDRDRRLADPWSLKSEIFLVLQQALQTGKLDTKTIYNLLNQEQEEAKAVVDNLWRSDTFIPDQLANYFKTQYGDAAIPVTSIAESIEASHFGFKDIAVAQSLKKILEHSLGTFEKKKQSRSQQVKTRYSLSDLSEEEKNNLLWVTNLLGNQYPYDLQVVNFLSNTILGLITLSTPPQIEISKSILKNKRETLYTVVHELAHIAGTDGSVEHINKMANIFTEIIERCLG